MTAPPIPPPARPPISFGRMLILARRRFALAQPLPGRPAPAIS